MISPSPDWPEFVQNVPQLASVLGVGRATAYRWLTQGCPRRPDGSFHVLEVAQWAATMRADADARKGPQNVHARTRDVERAPAVAPVAPPPPTAAVDQAPAVEPPAFELLDARRSADLESKQLRNELLRIQLERTKAEYVHRDRVAELLAERMMLFRRRLDVIVRTTQERLASTSSAAVCADILERSFDDLLRDAYGSGVDIPEGDST